MMRPFCLNTNWFVILFLDFYYTISFKYSRRNNTHVCTPYPHVHTHTLQPTQAHTHIYTVGLKADEN